MIDAAKGINLLHIGSEKADSRIRIRIPYHFASGNESSTNWRRYALLELPNGLPIVKVMVTSPVSALCAVVVVVVVVTAVVVVRAAGPTRNTCTSEVM